MNFFQVIIQLITIWYLDSNNDTTIPTELTLTSPSNKTYTYYLNRASQAFEGYYPYNAINKNYDSRLPRKLDESGLWYLSIYCNDKAQLWGFSDEIWGFNENSYVEPYGWAGSQLNIILRVLTNSEYEELINARASARSTEVLEKQLTISIITAVIMVILVAAAVTSAGFSYKSIKKQEEYRKTLIRPKISAKLDFVTPLQAALLISNIGRGSATDVNIEVETIPKGGKIPYYTPFLNENEKQLIHFKDNFKNLAKNFNKIIVIAKYRDLENVNYKESIPIDLKKIKEAVDSGRIGWMVDDISKIRRSLENIEKNLKKKFK